MPIIHKIQFFHKNSFFKKHISLSCHFTVIGASFYCHSTIIVFVAQVRTHKNIHARHPVINMSLHYHFPSIVFSRENVVVKMDSSSSTPVINLSFVCHLSVITILRVATVINQSLTCHLPVVLKSCPHHYPVPRSLSFICHFTVIVVSLTRDHVIFKILLHRFPPTLSFSYHSLVISQLCSRDTVI